MKNDFAINTLHRGKYMLSFFLLLFLFGGLSSLLPAQEIVKIIAVLFTIPVILYFSVRISKNSSTWSLNEDSIILQFSEKTIPFKLDEIDHIRSLTRSGGTLYVFYFKKRSPARFWRNKLFQSEDDQIALQQALTNSSLEYYKF